MLRFGGPFTQATTGLTKELRRTVSTLNPQMSIQRFADFSPEVQHLATKLEDARSKNYQIPPLTTSVPDLDQGKSYRVTAALRALRCERNNDEVVGRKIGFTNKSIWPEFNVDRSNWSYMYRSSVVDLDQQRKEGTESYLCDLSALSNLEPKIEPEIVLGLKAKPEASMNDEQILECIEWIAHGFEIVASVYPGWKFTAADTTAAFALHGKLLLGRKCYLPMRSVTKTELLKQLERFEIKLLCNNSVAEEGVGKNVLGSPVKALRHLAELLEKDEINMPLQAGEMVPTGTLTRALGIKNGGRWQTEIDGLDVSPLDVRFEMKG